MMWTAGGVLLWPNFFRRFGITSWWRKACYFVIGFYIVASVPGHPYFLLTGNTAYFRLSMVDERRTVARLSAHDPVFSFAE